MPDKWAPATSHWHSRHEAGKHDAPNDAQPALTQYGTMGAD